MCMGELAGGTNMSGGDTHFDNGFAVNSVPRRKE